MFYSSCSIGYVLIIGRTHKRPVCTLFIKNYPEKFIYILTRKPRFHKQYIMLYCLVNMTHDNNLSVKGNKHEQRFFSELQRLYLFFGRIFYYLHFLAKALSILKNSSTVCKSSAETYKTNLIASFYLAVCDCVTESDRDRCGRCVAVAVDIDRELVH